MHLEIVNNTLLQVHTPDFVRYLGTHVTHVKPSNIEIIVGCQDCHCENWKDHRLIALELSWDRSRRVFRLLSRHNHVTYNMVNIVNKFTQREYAPGACGNEIMNK